MRPNIAIRITLFISILFLCNCTQKIVPYKKIDTMQKTVTIPKDNKLYTLLEQELSANGWKVISGISTDDYKNTKIRYKLTISHRSIAYCFTCKCITHYNVMLIDNKNKEKVAKFYGYTQDAYCIDEVVGEIVEWMKTNQQ